MALRKRVLARVVKVAAVATRMPAGQGESDDVSCSGRTEWTDEDWRWFNITGNEYIVTTTAICCLYSLHCLLWLFYRVMHGHAPIGQGFKPNVEGSLGRCGLDGFLIHL